MKDRRTKEDDAVVHDLYIFPSFFLTANVTTDEHNDTHDKLIERGHYWPEWCILLDLGV